MRILVGTSGYNYPEWKGTFYPDDLPATKMLAFYAERHTTVEINYTFYRMPNARLLAGWVAQTPPGFTFTLKAPRRITHDMRLRNCGELVSAFCETASTLGDRLGALLFQLPPSLKRDLPTLDAFLDMLPPRLVAAFEFRHDSWHDEEVYARFRARNLSLCIADTGERTTPIVETADYGYFRLRDEGYRPDDLRHWAARIAERTGRWGTTFVYFKHEEAGKGPEFARALMDALQELGVNRT
jgi:uncharacterized protein YecE (DUF72 family)